MKVHYPKLYNMAHLLALNVLLLPKDLTFFSFHTLTCLTENVKHAHLQACSKLGSAKYVTRVILVAEK